jgi:hypothetical protein
LPFNWGYSRFLKPSTLSVDIFTTRDWEVAGQYIVAGYINLRTGCAHQEIVPLSVVAATNDTLPRTGTVSRKRNYGDIRDTAHRKGQVESSG